MNDRTCFNCLHYSVCTWRLSHDKESNRFLTNDESIATLQTIYTTMASVCRHFLQRDEEPRFKEDWFKIATKTYDEEVERLIGEGMESENARHVGFREAVLAAVQSESFLTLARQVPILEAEIAKLKA